MPLLCGLHTGGVTGCKPICRAIRPVCSAVWAEPLSLSHCSVIGQLTTEALFHTFLHRVADTIAAVPYRTRDPADGLAITAVQGEGHTQFGNILATKLKTVRAPTCIACFHCMRPSCRRGGPGCLTRRSSSNWVSRARHSNLHTRR